MNTEQDFMQTALKQAQEAFANDEVPVGAVIAYQGRLVAKAYNQVELLKDATAHAEMLAITQAERTLGCKWLLDCDMFVTLEPCSMCAGALVLARIKRLFWGAPDPKSGACGSVLNIVRHAQLNHRIEVQGHVMERECGALLTEFFVRKRAGVRENSS